MVFKSPVIRLGIFSYNEKKNLVGLRPVFEQIKIAAAEGLKLPKDVMLGEALISFVGRCSVTIENYRGILIYDDCTVKLQAKNCKLQIHGRRLHIDYYNHDEMRITGLIQSMEFGD